jgi:ParB/RepB/Spo0J family partition protein
MSRDILLSQIDPDPNQPRTHFDNAAIEELAQSMAANGLAVPVLVRPVDERYMLVHGERRWRAAQHLGWETIPAEVRELSEEEAHWLALVENVQRADLSPIEEARAYRAYLDTGITQQELGRRIGKTQSYIAHKVRLLTLPDPLVLLLDRKALTEGHARQILRLRNMYTDEPVWQRELDAFPDPRKTKYEPAGYILQLCAALRVEDKAPYIYPASDQEASVLFEACVAFHEFFVRHNGTIPLWTVGVFTGVCMRLGHR